METTSPTRSHNAIGFGALAALALPSWSSETTSSIENATGLPSAAIAALVAGFVSVVVGLLTYLSTMRGLRHQRDMQERSREHSLSMKLIDLRLSVYPDAFEITDDLRGEFLFRPELSWDELQAVSRRLAEWHKKRAAFILSAQSISAWYAINSALAPRPDVEGHIPAAARNKIWDAKNKFRASLRNDLQLLYVEETVPTDH